MKLTTTIMFLVKFRATFMFTTFKIIEKQESYKIKELKRMKNMFAHVLVIFKFKFSNIILTRVFVSITRMRSCPSGFQLALKALCHVCHPQVLVQTSHGPFFSNFSYFLHVFSQ